MRFLSLNLLPWVAAGLTAVIVTVIFAAIRRRRAIRALGKRGGLVTNASPVRRVVRTVALITGCVLAGVAALRPITGTILTEHRLPAKNLVILLDVSKSMAAVDANGLSRLEAAKLHARELMTSRASDRIGLIVFSGEAFVECPVTRSRSILNSRLDLAKPGMLPVDGTDLAGALQRARDLLGENPPKGSSILLLSDGDNVMGDPLAELEELRKRNLPVHTMTFGTPGTPAPLPAGLSRDPNAASTADAKTMADIAARTDGTAFIGDPAQLDVTVARMNPTLDAVNVGGNDVAREFRERPVDVYAWPLGVALGCLLLRFFLPLRSRQWHPLTTTAAIALMLLAPNLHAAEPEQKPVAATAYDTSLETARTADKPLMLVFTGSDWSEASIRFEREILSHEIYREWEQRSVISLPVDLPRRTIPDEVRRQGRDLLKKYNVTTYPTAVFINSKDGTELGRLGHNTAGPAAWINRANAILRGDRSVSDSDRGASKLSAETLSFLDAPSVSAGERSTRYYNEALQLEASDPAAALGSKDRIALLDGLLSSATELAGNDKRLSFPPRLKLATLQHLRGLKPDPQKPANNVRQLESAQASYASAATVAPANDPDLSHNLAAVTRDLEKARATLACWEAFQKAAKIAATGNAIEDTFHRNLENWVTTGSPVNDRRIEDTTAAINDLIVKADAANDPRKEDYRKAAAELLNCPAPHGKRDLKASAEAFKKAYDLLVPPQMRQQAKQPSEGEGEGEGQGDQDEENDEPKQAEDPRDQEAAKERDLSEQEGDAALRRAGEKDGAMRDQQLKKLGKNRKSAAPGQDR